MDELEEARQRRLRELQEQQAQQGQSAADAEAAAQAEAAIESLLQQALEPEARERLTRIRMSRPDLADQVTRQIAAAAQSGRLQRRITDADLRALLQQVAPPNRDIQITRK